MKNNRDDNSIINQIYAGLKGLVVELVYYIKSNRQNYSIGSLHDLGSNLTTTAIRDIRYTSFWARR